MQGLRLVAIYAVAIAAVIGLQLWPVTGAVLMLFLGAVWAALLLNAMLLHVGLWAAIGKIERPWLALPLAVYLGWAAVGGYAYLQAREWQAAINAANDAAPRLAAGDTVFIVTGDDERIGDEAAVAYAKVLKNATVYGRDRRFERTFDTRCQGNGQPDWRQHGQVPVVDRSYPGSPARHYGGACLVSRVEPVPAQGISIRVRPLAEASALLRLETGKAVVVSRRTAGAEPQRLAELRQGVIKYPMPFPWFVAGCFLNSSHASWDCAWLATGDGLTVGQGNDYGRYDVDLDQATFVAQRLGVAHQ